MMKVVKYSDVCRCLPAKLLGMISGDKRFMVGQPQLPSGAINLKFFNSEQEAVDGVLTVKIDPSFPTMIVDLHS
jgi:hypothetical protein